MWREAAKMERLKLKADQTAALQSGYGFCGDCFLVDLVQLLKFPLKIVRRPVSGTNSLALVDLRRALLNHAYAATEWTDRQTGRQTDGETDGRTDRQAGSTDWQAALN